MIDNVVYEATVKLGHERVRVINEMIELHLQPKPWWLPKIIWGRIIARLLKLEVTV